MFKGLTYDEHKAYRLLESNCKTLQEAWDTAHPVLVCKIALTGFMSKNELREFAIYCAIRNRG